MPEEIDSIGTFVKGLFLESKRKEPPLLYCSGHALQKYNTDNSQSKKLSFNENSLIYDKNFNFYYFDNYTTDETFLQGIEYLISNPK